MNSFGRLFRLHLFGESHGKGVGVVLDGVPPGLAVDLAAMQRDLDLRRPGTSRAVSRRRESDRVEALSGLLGGRATGAPLALWIPNEDADSRPYADLGRTPRPGHGDYPNAVWSKGAWDFRGGGHASGRLTAPLVAAGSVAQAILKPYGLRCAAHLHQVHDLAGPPHAVAAAQMEKRAARSPLHTAHPGLEAAFAARIEAARKGKDSVGGVVEFACEGLPPGLGDPFFDSVESRLAHLLLSIPAVKGVSFGAGFAAAAMKGSEHNDAFVVRRGKVAVAGNRAGGILGGRTTGAAVTGHVAVKPTSSLPGRDQQTVDLAKLEPARLRLSGRHDPCIAVRAVPVVQAACRIVLADFVLQARAEGLLAATQTAE